MPKIASAATLSALLLAACSGPEQASAPNGALQAGANGAEAGSPSDPAQPAEPGAPAAPVDGVAEPAPSPPPDAVSHPNGYLPPAPEQAEPAGANSSDPDPPATEDEYLRNGQ